LNPQNIKAHQWAGVNAAGKSSRTVNVRMFFKSSLSATNTFASGAYSAAGTRHDRDRGKFFPPVRQRLEQRDPLRAARQAAARALHVRAADGFARRRDQFVLQQPT
jgi:hypothetical protein